MATSKTRTMDALTTNDVKSTADRDARQASLARHLVTGVEPGRTNLDLQTQPTALQERRLPHLCIPCAPDNKLCGSLILPIPYRQSSSNHTNVVVHTPPMTWA
ncbi:hypothetical protein D7B24_001143 [Verticillium nonalfalfae]|uniref:Uncharacterized protein n=1 Tax=Verticillium nonalfalfae TaxID=1051616 RepID=A0A3M9Y1G8_9PEZI|nr:uncharacterized protein D7B24_001143 [Verticillium nonalfalfae]RNJ53955.1 hypothetical protein D7B24_001143 [Verticillium nonalfalfae]